MDKVLIVGGSGFIGTAVQQHVLDEGLEDKFTFSFNENPEKIDARLGKVRLDLLKTGAGKKIRQYPIAVYVAGNMDHGLAERSPSQDLDLNVRAFLNFMKEFRGSLVLLSSQATYYGLEGEIPETVDHVATVPYGLSKQMTEEYAKYFMKKGALQKLWIFKLMYAFGRGEKERRLIPRCANAVRSNQRVRIFGGGKSFLNPLSSAFIAQVLLRATAQVKTIEGKFLEVTNINYPEKVSVKDVVTFLNSVKHFDYEISESGEEWPVKFWGNTGNLLSHMREWNMKTPNLWDNLKDYFTELITGKTHG
ncbi:MAG: NAD(P)-dependent oxidoreductase [Candidatus Bathyarchaeota archaeon]|nr:NAD(P)-dependent oxidoreductase [Candidatus Bathyarchaeota archaeon]